MAKSVQINLSLDTQSAVKNMAGLEVETEKTLSTLGDMREEAERLNKALEGVEVGTEAYEELRKEMIKVNREIKNQELAMEALDNEQVASELKSVAGGFMDMAGGMALVGAGNQSLEKVVQTMAMVEGATKIVTGAMESYASLMKLSNVITTAYSAAVQALSSGQLIAAAKTKILTVAQTVLNAVMTANPIGLIVVAIGSLVAGLVLLGKKIKGVIKWIKDMSKYLLVLLGPLGLVALAYIKMSEATKENAAIAKAAHDVAMAGIKARIKELDKLIEQRKKERDEMREAYELEIALVESLGQNSTEMRRQMLEETLAANELIVKDTMEKMRLTQELTGRGIQFDNQKDVQKYYDDLLKEGEHFWEKKSAIDQIALIGERENLKKSVKQYEDANKQKTKSEIDLNNFRKKLWEEEQRRQQKIIDDETKGWEEYEKNRIEMMDDGLEKELQLRQFQFEQETKNLKDNLDSHVALRKQAEEKLLEDISSIRYKYAKKDSKEVVQIHQDANKQIQKNSRETTEVTLKDRIDAWQSNNAQLIETIQESFAIAADSLNQIFSLAQDALNEQAEQASYEREQRYSKETESLKAQLANREIDQQQYDNKLKLIEQKRQMEERMAARKAFNIDKGMRISQAIMGTAQAVISGLSAPFPLGIIQSAINAAAGAAQIGIISAQKFRAAKGGVVPGMPSNVDSVDALLAPGEMVINSTSAQMFPQTLSAINQAGGGISLAPQISSTEPVYADNKPDQRVIVVESDITDVQNRVTRVKEAATIG